MNRMIMLLFLLLFFLAQGCAVEQGRSLSSKSDSVVASSAVKRADFLKINEK